MQTPHIKITETHWLKAVQSFTGGHTYMDACNKAIEIALAEQATEQYITAKEARKLGAGNAKWFNDFRKMWRICDADLFGPEYQYRAIKQPEPVEPEEKHGHVSNLLTQSELKKALHYNQDTGVFTRIETPNGGAKVGTIAGGDNGRGYWAMKVNGKKYKAHRLAWFYMTGKFPKHEIDHINGITGDNRWCNLREATRQQNNQNKGICKTNSLGLKGVCSNGKAFRAQIYIDGKKTCLGTYTTAEEAHAVYTAKAKVIYAEFFNDGSHEVHAELKAMYEQQVKDGTLDNYVWEYKFHLSKEFVPLDGSVVGRGQLLTYADHEYRCTPKPPHRAPPPLVWPHLECVHDWVQNLQDAHRTCIYCKKSEPIETLA